MPFKSKKQQRFMFENMPEIAKEWAEKTDFSKLPNEKDCDDLKPKDIFDLTEEFVKQTEK
jgi:hypothetical protein